MPDLKYLPADPDRWPEFEVTEAEAKETLIRNVHRITELCTDNAALLLEHEDLLATAGGVANCAVGVVMTAMKRIIRDPDDTMLYDAFEALAAVSDKHGGDNADDGEAGDQA